MKPKASSSHEWRMTEINQAHTCKTFGVVTKPESIASTHAQMDREYEIARARVNVT